MGHHHNTRRRLAALAFGLLVAAPIAALAAPADPDPDFGDGGVAIIDLAADVSAVAAVPTEEGGLLVSGGRDGDGYVAKVDQFGDLDRNFGTNGVVTVTLDLESALVDLAIDSRGRIVAVGSTSNGDWRVFAARWLPDGRPDTSFSGDGVAEPDLGVRAIASSLALTDGDGIVLTGSTDTTPPDGFVARLDESGELDIGFAGDGVLVETGGSPEMYTSVEVDDADRIWVGGIVATPVPTVEAVVRRLLPDGTPDGGFQGGAAVLGASFDAPVLLARHPKSGMTVGYTAVDGWTTISRLDEDGQIDLDFGAGGQARVEPVSDVISSMVDADGIAVTGFYDGLSGPEIRVVRVTYDGVLDPDFDADGELIIDGLPRPFAMAMARAVDGGLFIVGSAGLGSSDLMVVKLEGGRTPPTAPPTVPPTTEVGADRFVDDDESVFEEDIEALAGAGITQGCNPPVNDRFCPDEAVTRGQMAAFLHRALDAVLTPGAPVEFVDDDGSVFESDIEWLGATGVTLGCNPPVNDRFCPDDAVTRGQMAAFLHRALEGVLVPGSPVEFVDDEGSVFEDDIEWLGATGVTLGCDPPVNDRFCPDDAVTRGQMAAFLVRALDLG